MTSFHDTSKFDGTAMPVFTAAYRCSQTKDSPAKLSVCIRNFRRERNSWQATLNFSLEKGALSTSLARATTLLLSNYWHWAEAELSSVCDVSSSHKELVTGHTFSGGGGVRKGFVYRLSQGYRGNYTIAQHLLTTELISRRSRDGPHDIKWHLPWCSPGFFFYFFSKEK